MNAFLFQKLPRTTFTETSIYISKQKATFFLLLETHVSINNQFNELYRRVITKELVSYRKMSL